MGLLWQVVKNKNRLILAILALPLVFLILLGSTIAGLGSILEQRVIVSLTGNLQDRLQQNYKERNFISDIGIVQMATFYAEKTIQNPFTLVIGLGPSNYGTPAALTKISKGDAPLWVSSFFQWEVSDAVDLAKNDNLQLLGLSAKTSVFGSVLGELGLPSALAFILLTTWPLLIRLPLDRTRKDDQFLFWLKMAYLAVVLQSGLNVLGAWDNDMVLTPLIAGLVIYANPDPRTVASRPEQKAAILLTP
jgi:hypothetical protein